MSRLAAYLGPATKTASLLEGGSYSLTRQASDYPDGFGLAWYPLDDDPEPIRLLGRGPVWSDDRQLTVARRYSAECIMASIRKANQPNPELSGNQPFQFGRYLFAHDGELQRFEEVYARALRSRLSDKAYNLVSGNTDSELLFATWIDAMGDQEGPDAVANGLEQMVSVVQEIGGADAPATFGVVVTDGQCLVTLRTATDGPPPAMYTIVAGEDAPVPASGRVVASEPLFPGSWSSLDPHSLVIFTVEEGAAEAQQPAPEAE